MFLLISSLLGCRLTEACCDDLASILTSELCMLDMRYNQIGDQGFKKLFQALCSPHCKLQELKYVIHTGVVLFYFCQSVPFMFKHEVMPRSEA